MLGQGAPGSLSPLPTGGVTTSNSPGVTPATGTGTGIGTATPTAGTPTAGTPTGDSRFLRRVRVGSYDVWFFDLTGKYGSGGWAWWDNQAWHLVGDRIPVGFGPDHQRQLGIQPAGPVASPTGSTTVVTVSPTSTVGGTLLGQGGQGTGPGAPGTQAPTGATGTTATGTGPATTGQPVPTVGGRVFGPWYDATSYAGAVLNPPDPAYLEAVRQGRVGDYVRIREELAARFPSGGQLQAGDPWYRVVRIGDRDVELYDVGGKRGTNDGMVWWKAGVGWVDLGVEQPPGFRPELTDAYIRQQTARGRPPQGTGPVASGVTSPGSTAAGTGTSPAGGLLGTGYAETHGGIRQTIDPFTGRAATYPIPPAGAREGERLTQSSGGGGVVLGDGTRVVFDGSDTYTGGHGVRWERAVYDPQARRWTYFGLRGRTADGREWRADEAWYETTAGGLVARFRTGGKDGVSYIPGKA